MESNDKNSDCQQNNERGELLTDMDSLEAFTINGFKMLVEATKRSNNLPFSKNRDFYESFPSFHNLIENQADYVLSVLQLMIKYVNTKGNIQKRDDEDKFEMIVDANDWILENVGNSLDELSGMKKNSEPEYLSRKLDFINGSWNKNDRGFKIPGSQVLNKILNHTKYIEKPQLQFKNKINNDPNVPFEPKIKYKHNMLKPLAIIAEVNEDGICQFSHPYEFELEKFKPPKEQLMHISPKLYKTLEETPFFVISTLEEVNVMLKDLESYKEIAVDLEHHSYRSFQGFTCLMQISTRDTDYVVDTLLLRSELEVLNKVFTDSSVVKVFHGADSDILWLQRDLSLYIVNMFDTHQAAKLLHFPKLSLAYLLSYYCKVNAQKHFQLADWRVRPLPQELITYAREDTHYLLFIYDNLRNALIEKANGQTNLLESVISESTRICLKRYIKPLYECDGYLDIYHRSKKLFDNRQKFALQKLFEWRDKMARELDESYAYVLPNHMMLNISEVLPREAQGILACCNPIPIPVRQHLLALHQIILKAREQPLLKPVLEEQRFHRHPTTVNLSGSPLQCPHDLNHEGEFRDDLPVLFSENNDVRNFYPTNFSYSQPIVSIFEKSQGAQERIRLLSVAKKAMNLSPYHRYKLSKTFSESLDVKHVNNTQKDKMEQTCTAQKEVNLVSTPKSCAELLEKNASSEKNIEMLVTSTSCTDQTNKEEITHVQGKKRKIRVDNGTYHSKKSLNNTTSYVHGQKSDNAETVDSQIQKQGKKNFKTIKKKEFQPFDYNSVDFKNYQNLETLEAKKTKRKHKAKRPVTKKINISI